MSLFKILLARLTQTASVQQQREVDAFLGQAVDLADLERRQRELERSPFSVLGLRRPL